MGPVPTVHLMNLHVERVNGPDALQALVPEWEALDEGVRPRSPFTSSLWVRLWWKHLRHNRFLFRQEPFFHVVRDARGKLVAVVPLVIMRVPTWPPLQLRLLQFVGSADGNITELRRIICLPQDEPRVAAVLIRYLQSRRSEWDIFLWTGIPADTAAQFRLDWALRTYRETPEYVLPLPTSWEQLRSSLSPNMKEKIRKSYKLLSRDGHDFSFGVVDHPEAISAALEDFFALHAARAGLKNAPKHRDYFRSIASRAFISDHAEHMAKLGKVRLFQLVIGRRVVACRLAYLLGDDLYLYYSGFDPAWRRHSVMTTLTCECVKWAIKSGIKVVNLSTGTDRSKLRWKPQKRMFHDAILTSTWRGNLAGAILEILRRRARTAEERANDRSQPAGA